MGLYHGLLRLFGQSVNVNFSNSVRICTQRGQQTLLPQQQHAPGSVQHLHPVRQVPPGTKTFNMYMTWLLLPALLCSCALCVTDFPPLTPASHMLLPLPHPDCNRQPAGQLTPQEQALLDRCIKAIDTTAASSNSNASNSQYAGAGAVSSPALLHL